MFLVVTSFAFSLGVVWYSKQTTALIIEKDLKVRELERSVFGLLLSMERNRKKYFLLGNPEYKSNFYQDKEKFRSNLIKLEALGLSEQETGTWTRLQKRFEDYLQKDPFSAPKDFSHAEDIPDLLLEDAHSLLRLNQDRMNLRVAQMNRLEDETIRVGAFWGGLALLAAGLLAFFLIRSIARPIGMLQKGTKEIAEGNFAHRVDLVTHDELGDLANAFNEMAYQLGRLDDMKAHFMAIASHELKTPLTSMKEAVDLLREEAVGPLSPKQRRMLDINAAGIQRLAVFADDILHLTRMEAGLAPLNKARFDLQGLLEERLGTFRLLAERKQISLSATLQPDPFPAVFGDAGRLEQVLANLLNNAIYFTPCGGRVSLQAEHISKDLFRSLDKEDQREDKARHWLKFSISDTGEGIPKEEWKRVFDKFYQIQKKSNIGRGSGLGLAIAKGIVQGHEGSIWVEESSQKGTTFVFVLPQRIPKEDETETEAPAEGLLGCAA